LGALLLLLLAPAASALAATLFVDTTVDENDNTNGVVSLREAIAAINAGTDGAAVDLPTHHVGVDPYGTNDTITFNISGAGVKTINVGAAASALNLPLPTIGKPLVIEGYTQGVAHGNTLSVGNDAVLLIELNGTSAGVNPPGLNINAANVTVRGLVIHHFLNGIQVQAAGTGAKIEGNFIGTNPAGTTRQNNSGSDITIAAMNVTVGAATTGGRNLISGSNAAAISIASTANAGVVIEGNYIGTNAAGTGVVGNDDDGILVDGANGVTIGGTTVLTRNVIMGNANNGITVQAGATGVTIKGNYVGVAADDSVALGNDNFGIGVSDVPSLTIGGTAAGSGNVISGNGASGISAVGGTTTGLKIQGNLIGTSASGTVPHGNASHGIQVFSAPAATIGGTSAAARNVIAANGGDGILMGSLTGGTIEGNYIGIDVNGTGSAATTGNQGNGIEIDTAPSVTVGGTATGAGNVISNSGLRGILVSNVASTNTMIQGNLIGLNPAGTAARPNTLAGVHINGAPNATIGGSTAARNVISGNLGDGILVAGMGATGAIIQSNYIGTDINGTGSLGNTLYGIHVGANQTTVGGTAAGVGNVIAFNGQGGIGVEEPGPGQFTQNSLRGNSIFSNTGLGIDLAINGVTLNDTGDGDNGANDRQNFPVLTSASIANGGTVVGGTLNSIVSTTFALDFFASPSCDASTYGEGKTYLGSASTMTDGSGNASFIATGLMAATAGNAITATATDPVGNTSEFSVCLTAAVAGVTVTPTTLSLIEGGSISNFTINLTSIPASAVTVTLGFTSSQLTVTPTSITFQPDSSALQPRPVAVSAVDNTTVDGTRVRQITFSVTSSDPAYNNMTVSPVSVTIQDNDGNAPTAAADSYSVNALSSISVPAPGVLGNDTPGSAGPPIHAQIASQPNHGAVTLNADGSFTYTPASSFSGTDSFTYNAVDSARASTPATVTITVNAVQCGPRPRITNTPVAGGGQLTVTVQAAALPTGGANAISQITFGTLKNAQVTLNGQNITNDQVVTLPANTTTVTVTVRRVTAGQATTVPYTVKDTCGSWPTFVGGGTSAGF
jgi:hypothetical protein